MAKSKNLTINDLGGMIKDGFDGVNKQLNDQGLFGNVFTFIDASSLITKAALWEERDAAIKDGYEKLNNKIDALILSNNANGISGNIIGLANTQMQFLTFILAVVSSKSLLGS